MPKKPERKLRPDVAETAYRVMREATGQAPKSVPYNERTTKNPDAVARGRKGGEKGGKARAESMSPEQRRIVAEAGAKARWPAKD